MVLFVEVLAIGPFRERLTSHYEYSLDQYAGVREGAPIVRRLFGITEGTAAGIEVARSLGISEVWDFNQHKIDPSRIDFEALELALRGLHSFEEYLPDLDALRSFAAEGYDLYFLPNG